MQSDTIIYLDNAATSFPKPPEVGVAMVRLLGEISLSPGRSAHSLSLAASREIFAAREAVADLFHVRDSSRVVFTANVTESLNVGIFGLLGPGDHVITTGMEHNSVMRPLRFLEKSQGVEISILPTSATGEIDPAGLPPLMRKNTRLIVINHVSNVTGAMADLAAIGRQKGDAVFMVDAAQSAGIFDIDMEALQIDFLAFTGHKGLFGPTGTGGFVLRPGLDLPPFKMGGTGSNSEFMEQPDLMPDRFEAGTPNTLGIAGLAAGLAFIKKTGIGAIRRHEQELTAQLLAGLSRIPGISIYGPPASENRGAVVSLRMHGKSVSELAHTLDREYHIMSRAGLHCAPAAHQSIGTYPDGTLRLSVGFFNTATDTEACLGALQAIAGS